MIDAAELGARGYKKVHAVVEKVAADLDRTLTSDELGRTTVAASKLLESSRTEGGDIDMDRLDTNSGVLYR